MADDYKINPAESFIKNIIRIALHKGIPRQKIADIGGIPLESLLPSRFDQPLVSFHLLTNEKCELLINEIAPEQDVHLRDLEGYIKRTANAQFFDAANSHPILRNFAFGSAYRFMREQKPVAGKYLRMEDCKIKNYNASEVSQFELGHISVTSTIGNQLLGKLGYEAGDDSLKKFCEDLAVLFSAYETRRHKLGKAIYVHVFPDSNKSSKRDTAITQKMVHESLNSSPGRMKEIYSGKNVPTAQEAEIIAKLFGYNNEQDFYMAAEAKYENAEVTLPAPTISEKMAELGLQIKTVREELSLSQADLQTAVYRGIEASSPKSHNTFISYLESGRRATPLLAEEQKQLIHALGCSSLNSLSQLTGQVAALNDFRAKYFRGSIKILADEGNDAAKELLLRMRYTGKDSNRAWVIRDALSALNISERKLYEQAKAPLDVETTINCEVIARYVETQHLSYDQTKFVGRASSHLK